MIRKLMLCPWFGSLPEWFPLWQANAERLREHGYEFLVDTDLERFRRLTRQLVGVEFNGREGGSKIHDYRPALGVIYGDEIDGFDFWGHTDLDCLYGRVDRFVTDEFLAGLDVHSNHHSYLAGPWTLYRNTDEIAWAFRDVEGWDDYLREERTNGWVEEAFSRHMEERFDVRYTYWQTRDLNSFDRLAWGEDGTLYEGTVEVCMAHFRRTKVYPEGCRLALA